LAVVLRRPLRIVLLAAVAVVASGCATFTDDNVIARVGNAELSSDDLVELIAEIPDGNGISGADVGDRAPGELARQAIGSWIAVRGLDASGVLARYREGIAGLDVACLKAIPAADSLHAQTILGRLESGEAWDKVVAAEAAEAVDRDRAGCLVVSQLPAEVVQALAGISATSPYRTIDLSGQSVVIAAQTDDELLGIEFLTALQNVEPDSVAKVVAGLRTADVYVDPRYGTYDPTRLQVVPLG
jgi:hypothetical protein